MGNLKVLLKKITRLIKYVTITPKNKFKSWVAKFKITF